MCTNTPARTQTPTSPNNTPQRTYRIAEAMLIRTLRRPTESEAAAYVLHYPRNAGHELMPVPVFNIFYRSHELRAEAMDQSDTSFQFFLEDCEVSNLEDIERGSLASYNWSNLEILPRLFRKSIIDKHGYLPQRVPSGTAFADVISQRHESLYTAYYQGPTFSLDSASSAAERAPHVAATAASRT